MRCRLCNLQEWYYCPAKGQLKSSRFGEMIPLLINSFIEYFLYFRNTIQDSLSVNSFREFFYSMNEKTSCNSSQEVRDRASQVYASTNCDNGILDGHAKEKPRSQKRLAGFSFIDNSTEGNSSALSICSLRELLQSKYQECKQSSLKELSFSNQTGLNFQCRDIDPQHSLTSWQ